MITQAFQQSYDVSVKTSDASAMPFDHILYDSKVQSKCKPSPTDKPPLNLKCASLLHSASFVSSVNITRIDR